MRYVMFVILLSLIPFVTNAVVLFNDGDAMVVNGTFEASKAIGSGGMIFYARGVIDGGTLAIETQPFRESQGIEWIPLAECSITTLPAVCKVAVGTGEIRLAIAGGGGSLDVQAIGHEASAVVGEIDGAGGSGGTAIAIDTDQDGTNEFFITLANVRAEFDFDDDGGTDLFVVKGSPEITFATAFRELRFQPSLVTVGGFCGPGFNTGPGLCTDIAGGVRNIAVSNVLPTFVMLASDQGTGVGRDSTSGGMSLIDNNVEAIRVLSTLVKIADGLAFGPPRSNIPPGTCDITTEGEEYYDLTSSVPCYCNGTDWLDITDSAMVCA